jgi:hypothetical protein
LTCGSAAISQQASTSPGKVFFEGNFLIGIFPAGRIGWLERPGDLSVVSRDRGPVEESFLTVPSDGLPDQAVPGRVIGQ